MSRTAGSPWENGNVESFNGRLRDECLNLERFDTLLEAQVVVETRRHEYDHVRPPALLDTDHRHRPPSPKHPNDGRKL